MTSPTELLLVRYRDYLADERGLAEATLGHYLAVARLFLSVQFPDDDLGFLTWCYQSGAWRLLVFDQYLA